MKKILIFILAIAMVCSLSMLAGCGGKKAENVKLGLGVYSSISDAASASADKGGSAGVTVTAAAVLIGADGKIVACKIESAQNNAKFNINGEFVKTEIAKTKSEQGYDYGMKKYGGTVKEWFEQVEALEKVVIGKTPEQVKSLVASDNSKGNDEVISAGCTIGVSDFIRALTKACENAQESKAVSDNMLDIGFVTTSSGKSATAEADGNSTLDTVIVAAARDTEGKTTAMTLDSVQAKVNFDAAGAVKTENTDDIKTKNELGDGYGMSKYGTDLNGDGKILEWNAQAKVFADYCVGKTSAQIAASVLDTGYGNDDIQSAGCTISVSPFAEAAVKALGK